MHAKTKEKMAALEGALLKKREAFNKKFDEESAALLAKAEENLEKLKQPFKEIDLQMLTDPGVVDGEYLQAPGFDMRLKVCFNH